MVKAADTIELLTAWDGLHSSVSNLLEVVHLRRSMLSNYGLSPNYQLIFVLLFVIVSLHKEPDTRTMAFFTLWTEVVSCFVRHDVLTTSDSMVSRHFS